MSGAGKKAWGYYRVGDVWLPLQVDANGKAIVDMSAITLDDLADVFGAGAVEGDMLYFDAVSGMFMVGARANLANLFAALTILNDLGDVNVPAPADGDLLYWNAAAGKWQSKAGKLYVAIAAPTAIWKSAAVSSTPRTATVSSVAGDVITLTGNFAYRFGVWGASPDNMNAANVLLHIKNTTRNEWAWMEGRPAVNQLRVTDAADIAAWVLTDTVSTMVQMELDISPLIPAGATAVYVKDKVKDTGGPISGCYLYKNVGSTVAQNVWTQVATVNIAAFMIALIDASRHIVVKEVASGVNTLTSVVNVLGYFI